MVDWKEEKTVLAKSGPHEVKVGSPTQEFWEAWRRDKQSLKDQGFSVTKTMNGEWQVSHWKPVVSKDVIEESRALESDIEVPAPAGLNYFGYQKAGIEFASDKNALIADPPGLGKASPVDSLVHTPKGTVRIGDLKVGDQVVGSDGKPTTVTGVFPRGEMQIFRVLFEDNTHLEVARDHLWAVYREGESPEDAIVVDTETLSREHDHVRLFHDVPAPKFWVYKWGVQPLSGPLEYHDSLLKDLPLHPYLLGLYLGSPWVANHFREGEYLVSRLSEEVFEEIARLSPQTERGPSRGYEGAAKMSMPEYEGIALQILGFQDSEFLYIPDEYKYSTPENRIHLIQGLMDSGGFTRNISQKSRAFKLPSNTGFYHFSEQLCEDVAEVVRGLGGVAKMYERIPDYPEPPEVQSPKKNYAVEIALPEHIHPYRGSQAKVRHDSAPRHRELRRAIKGVEVTDEFAEMVCISVDAEDSLYVAENMIVTHNTIMTAGVVNMNKEFNNILVICPSSLKINWKRELDKWLIQHYKTEIATPQSYPEDADIVIINYDLVRKYEEQLKSREWDLLVADEAHALKSPTAQRTKIILGHKARKKADKVPPIDAKQKLFLTGTPILNKPIELFSLINALDPDRWDNKWKFGMKYCDAKHNGWGWDFNGASNTEELNNILRSTVMIRRSKEEALPELPPVFHQVIEMPSPANVRKLVREEKKVWDAHQEALDDLRAAVELAKVSDSTEDYNDAVAALKEGMGAGFSEMAKVRKELALAKLPLVIGHLEEAEDKVIVFFHHRDVGFALQEHFGDKAVMLIGGMKEEDKQKAVDEFQNNPSVKYFLGSITAAGVGITLTAASHVVFAELDFRPAMMEQAYGRANRVGQKYNVLVQYLLAEESLDVKIAQKLVDKQTIITQVLDDDVEFVDTSDHIKTPPPNKKSKHFPVREYSQKEKQELLKKLRFLAELDEDGARAKNQAGFNKVDTRIGRSLASQTGLSDKQAALAERILEKYSRQLSPLA